MQQRTFRRSGDFANFLHFHDPTGESFAFPTYVQQIGGNYVLDWRKTSTVVVTFPLKLPVLRGVSAVCWRPGTVGRKPGRVHRALQLVAQRWPAVLARPDRGDLEEL